MKSTQLPYFTAAKHVDDPNELVTQELPQVYYIAARIRERLPKQIDMEDLVSAGVIGLLEASRKFDSSKNVEFPIFARFRIRGAILDSLRELDWGSRSIRKKGREVTECITDLRKSLGREPTESEIATTLNVSLQQLQKTLGEIDGLYLMGSQGGSTDDWEEGPDLIESAPSQDDSPYEQFERAERREHLGGGDCEAVGARTAGAVALLPRGADDAGDRAGDRIRGVAGFADPLCCDGQAASVVEFHERTNRAESPDAGDV